MELDQFECIEMAVFDASTLDPNTYILMNGAAQQPGLSSIGFEKDIKILKLYNDGSTGVTISYGRRISDDTDYLAQDYLPSKGTMIIDLQGNHRCDSGYSSGRLNGKRGQLIYGKGDPSSADLNIYISGYR